MDRRHLITITLMCCLVAVTGCEPSSNASRDSGPDGQVVAADEPVAVHGANAARPLCVIVRQPGTSAEEIESAVTVPIERADYLIAALPLSAGTHKVEYRYDPLSLKLGSGCTAGMCVAGLWILVRSRRRRSDSPMTARDAEKARPGAQSSS